jgi:phage FluMu protein Com
MATQTSGILGSKSLEGPCPRCGRQLQAIHTVSQYGRPSVALLECPRCRYVCQTVVTGLWPEEAFPRTPHDPSPAR